MPSQRLRYGGRATEAPMLKKNKKKKAEENPPPFYYQLNIPDYRSTSPART